MVIKRRKPLVEISDYSVFRLHMWEQQDPNFNAHGSCFVIDGQNVPLTEGQAVLVPKPNFYYKDTWHCGSQQKAREILHALSMFPDIIYVEMNRRWVKVEWDHQGKEWQLPGQTSDEREKVRAKASR